VVLYGAVALRLTGAAPVLCMQTDHYFGVPMDEPESSDSAHLMNARGVSQVAVASPMPPRHHVAVPREQPDLAHLVEEGSVRQATVALGLPTERLLVTVRPAEASLVHSHHAKFVEVLLPKTGSSAMIEGQMADLETGSSPNVDQGTAQLALKPAL